MRHNECAVILLASGLSERFGPGNKLLADLAGKAVIDYAFDTISAAGFGACFAVVSDDAVSAKARKRGFVCVPNEMPEAGQGVALRLGAMAAKASEAKVVCIMLADMPFILPEHIENLRRKSASHEQVLSSYDGVKMPPAMFRGAAFERLLGSKNDQGAKRNMDMSKAATCALSRRAAMDIDTPAGLAAARLCV